MHIRPFRKRLPVTIVTLIALGIMLFLFFMHRPSAEESLEFYTPDGNGVGTFRVDITEMQSDPVYTEIKIVPEDMEPFQRFMAKFRNRPVMAKIPARGSHVIVPGRDIQCDGTLRVAGE